MFPAEILLLPGVPQVDSPALPADGPLVAAVGRDDRAAQDHVRRSLGHGTLQRSSRPGASAATTFVTRLRSGTTSHATGPIRPPAAGCPGLSYLGTRPGRTMPADNSPGCGHSSGCQSPCGVGPGAAKRTGKLPGHVESDTIGDQCGVSRQADFFGETSSTGSSAPSRRCPPLSACPPIWALCVACPIRP